MIGILIHSNYAGYIINWFRHFNDWRGTCGLCNITHNTGGKYNSGVDK